jgi:hypothetical protein
MGEDLEQAYSRARLGHVIRYIGRLRPAKVRGPRKPDATALSADLAVGQLQTIPGGLRLRSSATIHVTHSFVQITGERRRTEPELLA